MPREPMAEDLAEGRASNARVQITPLRVVEYIEEFAANPELEPLRDQEGARYSGIPLILAHCDVVRDAVCESGFLQDSPVDAWLQKRRHVIAGIIGCDDCVHTPVDTSVTVTVTLGTTAPEESLTIPAIEPMNVCACIRIVVVNRDSTMEPHRRHMHMLVRSVHKACLTA